MRREGADGGGERPPARLQVLGGHDGTFESFYLSQYRPLLRLAWGVEGRHDLAEEVVQDTMLAVHQHWAKVASYDKPGMYARRVLLNALVSRDRRRRRERRAVERAGPDSAVHHDAEPPGREFWAALRALPERQQQAVVLHYVEDCTVAEIAAVLDIAEGTVKVHLHRGRLALSDALAPATETEAL